MGLMEKKKRNQKKGRDAEKCSIFLDLNRKKIETKKCLGIELPSQLHKSTARPTQG
jgi:hypothetical protein